LKDIESDSSERPEGASGTFKRWWFTVGALGFGLALSVSILEITLTILNPFPLRVRGHKIELEKNVKRVFDNPGIPGLDTIIIQKRNSLGFRGPDPPSAFDSYVTALTVGGSTTECFYLSDSKTWPDLLLVRLQEHFDRFWLNNAGLDGHSTFGHLILMDQYITTMGVDFVLLMAGINDISRTETNPYDKLLFKGLNDYNRLPAFRRAIIDLAGHSKTMALIDNLFRHLEAKERGLSHGAFEHRGLDLLNFPKIVENSEDREAALRKHKSKYADLYRLRLIALVQLIRQYGTTPILLTQPALYGDVVDQTSEIHLGKVNVGGISGSLRWDILELYNDITRDTAQKLGLGLIDLARQMPKDSRYYYDFIHFNNAGAEVVAELIEPEICSIIAKRFPDRVLSPCTARD
jgi:lysophospholipase L1-like esterase